MIFLYSRVRYLAVRILTLLVMHTQKSIIITIALTHSVKSFKTKFFFCSIPENPPRIPSSTINVFKTSSYGPLRAIADRPTPLQELQRTNLLDTQYSDTPPNRRI